MKRRQQGEKPPAIRAAYQRYGIEGYYREFGASYRSPHEAACRAALQAALRCWQPSLRKSLDLACGSGEMTLALREAGCQAIDGIDPFTGAAYWERTGRQAQSLTFEQIAAGAIEGQSYDLIVCSFALHLAQHSWLPLLSYQLSCIAKALLVLAPHKRPIVQPEWGWIAQGELVVQRVHARYYLTAHAPFVETGEVGPG